MKPYIYNWRFDLRASPEALWPFIADTNRFNRDTLLPRVQTLGLSDDPRANQRRKVRLSWMGQNIVWDEEPFEWVRPERFSVRRRYHQGPVSQIIVYASLAPGEHGGTRLDYRLEVTPRNLLGRLAVPVQFGLVDRRLFARAFRRYDEQAVRAAAEQRAALDHYRGKVRLAPGGWERLTSIRDRLLSRGLDPEPIALLVRAVEEIDDLPAARLRPYALADEWGLERREILSACLHATREGMLDLRWDVLCPMCRNPREPVASLGALRSQVHCEACNIDYSVNFDQLVELTFSPAASIRPVNASTFCVGGPMLTPHIVLQQLLAPGERRDVAARLEPGRHRVRTALLRGGQLFNAGAGGAPAHTFAAAGEGWDHGEPAVSPTASLTLRNDTDREQLFIIERMAWSDRAATAAEVTALQVFRDLFAEEALRPGEQISVGSLTVLFTDLRGSTSLYREVGDAPAFGRVMKHFDALRQAVTENDGAVVKTIGDSVMGVFRNPAGAVRAAARARELMKLDAATRELVLKAGAHTGRCIAVTLNERLDYFGSTINIAARLVGMSGGGDLIISSDLHDDPGVRALLQQGGTQALPMHCSLRGYEGQEFDVWRLTSD